MRNKILVVLSVTACLFIGAAAPAQAAVRPMKERGSGQSEPISCPDFICFKFRAGAMGKPINEGTFRGTFRIPDIAPFTNNKGQACRPADGTGTFKRGVHKISVSFDGSACLVSKGSSGSKLRAYGRITDGEGNFNNAKGAGGLVINFEFTKGEQPMSYSWDGTIKGSGGAG